MEWLSSLSGGQVIMQVLGLPGLIFIVWYFDNKRYLRQEEARKEEMSINYAPQDILLMAPYYEVPEPTESHFVK